jgi:hypothetical protein
VLHLFLPVCRPDHIWKDLGWEHPSRFHPPGRSLCRLQGCEPTGAAYLDTTAMLIAGGGRLWQRGAGTGTQSLQFFLENLKFIFAFFQAPVHFLVIPRKPVAMLDEVSCAA